MCILPCSDTGDNNTYHYVDVVMIHTYLIRLELGALCASSEFDVLYSAERGAVRFAATATASGG